MSVVGAIAPKLQQAEIARAKRKPTGSLDAYDYYLRGVASLYRWTRDASGEALRLFYKAIDLDPNSAPRTGWRRDARYGVTRIGGFRKKTRSSKPCGWLGWPWSLGRRTLPH